MRRSSATSSSTATCRSGSDYALQASSLGGKPIAYQLAQVGTNPTSRQLPLGQVPFGGLNVIQYNYSVASATPDLTNPSAQLRSQFQVNNIPVFQFLAYYTTNLEITPAPDMNLHGRIHSNADIYVNDGGTMTIRDNPPNIPTVQISAVGNLMRGRSDGGGCYGTVTIAMLQDANNDGRLDTRNLNCGTNPVPQATVDQWLGSIRVNVPNIGLPTGYSTARGAGNQYWDNADLRIVLDLSGANDYTQKRSAPATRTSRCAASWCRTRAAASTPRRRPRCAPSCGTNPARSSTPTCR